MIVMTMMMARMLLFCVFVTATVSLQGMVLLVYVYQVQSFVKEQIIACIVRALSSVRPWTADVTPERKSDVTGSDQIQGSKSSEFPDARIPQ